MNNFTQAFGGCSVLACLAVQASAQSVLYSNGPWITGALSASNSIAPPGAQWSELGRDGAAANGRLGYAATYTPTQPYRVADDFTVPAASGGWNVQRIRIIGYQQGSGMGSTFTGITLRIFSGPPNAGGQVIFGNETMNRLQSTTFTGVYRIYNSNTPFVCGGIPAPIYLDRPLMEIVANVGHTLPPGTYWLDVGLTGTIEGPASVITTTMLNTRTASPNANALQRSGGVWIPLTDPGVGCSPASVAHDLVFEIIGTPASGGCYANCDGSTTQPVLNVADFGCFLSKFAAGHTYANCDGSTQPPVLNVADFGCFLSKFAGGCP